MSVENTNELSAERIEEQTPAGAGGPPAPVRGELQSQLLALLSSAKAPLLAIVGGILVGALLIVLLGQNPIAAYGQLLEGAFGRYNLPSTLNRAVPIVGAGLAAALAFRAGLFNLGVEGQLVLGGLTAALAAIYLPVPDALRLPVAILVAVVVGGGYSVLSAWFQFRFGVPILISSLLMNYPAMFFASYVVSGTSLGERLSGISQTAQVPVPARFAVLVPGSQLNAGAFITLGLALVLALVISRTVIGYEIRMRGVNLEFARYGGVRVRRLGYGVMLASGMIAGIVGAIEVLGVHYRFIDTALTAPLYAWVGLMAALLSGSNPIGVLMAGLFFSALETGGVGMERTTEIPRELSLVLQALIIMLIATRGVFRSDSADDAEG
jgi:simple sugar transport system permease protein